MRRLMLLRHAKTERPEPGERDRDRKLMKRGRADAPVIGAYMAHHGLGPDLALVSPADFPTAIEERWGRDAVHLILDPVGEATLAGDLTVLAPRGQIIVLAAMSGGVANLDLHALLRKRAEVRGSTLRSRPRAEKAALVARFRHEALPAFTAGRLRPMVDRVTPAIRAAEAFERMRANANTGKLLLDWTDA